MSDLRFVECYERINEFESSVEMPTFLRVDFITEFSEITLDKAVVGTADGRRFNIRGYHNYVSEYFKGKTL
jgi:hypothetical protein